MPTFLLIRHAEPAIRGVFLGQMDPPLSTRGKQQTADLASLKDSEENMTVYSSPLRRALQTASGLRFHELVILSDLREVDMGEWTGKQWVDIQIEWGSFARRRNLERINGSRRASMEEDSLRAGPLRRGRSSGRKCGPRPRNHGRGSEQIPPAVRRSAPYGICS
jgi:broad specificity phosphatase PhoE